MGTGASGVYEMQPVSRLSGARRMISSVAMARLKTHIEILEKALAVCTDSGLGRQIAAWIDLEKKKLANGTKENPLRISGDGAQGHR
jgi:hypothetical protein